MALEDVDPSANDAVFILALVVITSSAYIPSETAETCCDLANRNEETDMQI